MIWVDPVGGMILPVCKMHVQACPVIAFSAFKF